MEKTAKKLFLTAALLLTGVCWSVPATADAAPAQSRNDKTLSPYFFVESDDPEVDCLPLKQTRADVTIAGVIADVTVVQVYTNEGQKPLEAVYVFPASTRAAVYGMTMTIGERTIIATIKEREQARRDYEQARADGKSASLLEQQRANVFQMNVANILPGDVITAELRYTELLVPADSIYEFVYPTVVGPRYSNQPADAAPPAEKWIENPYLQEGENAPYLFDITVDIAAGMNIQELTCTSHKLTTSYTGPTRAVLSLSPDEKHGGNRDVILKYRLAGSAVESGLLLYEGEEENFFLLMTQPPERVALRQIPPREYIFIVDVSGSMNGFPLDISKKLLQDLIGNLRTTDRFNVLLFAGRASLMAEKSLPATPENIRKAINVIDRQEGGGGTELLPALKRALALPRSEESSRTVVIVTDGYVSVEKETFDLIRKRLGEANMFAFGIGSSVNRHLIEGMARAGMGEPFIITKPAEAPDKAKAFRAMIQSPVLTSITVDFGSFKAYDVEPPSVPDVLARRPVVIFGKWRGSPEGTITIKGMSGEGSYQRRIKVKKAAPSASNEALKYLWARHRIAVLGDYNLLRKDDKRIKEITKLGLTYNLLTAYTSFVAVDTRVRTKDGNPVSIKQPLPLPRGVSDYAVGGYGARKHRALRPAASGFGAVYKKEDISRPAPVVPAEETERDEGTAPQLTIVRVAVSGALSQPAVSTLLHKRLEQLSGCVKASQARKGGQIVFTITVSGKGTVANVDVKSMKNSIDTNKAKKRERCMIKHLKALQFSAPADGKPAHITLTLAVA